MKRQIFNSGKKYSFKNIRKSIMISLALAFFFAIGSVMTINFFITKRENDIHTIILTSQLRVLGQKIIEKIFAATARGSLDSTFLKEAQAWSDMHRAFRYRNPVKGANGSLKPERQLLLEGISYHQQELFEITTQKELKDLSERDLNDIRELEIKYLHAMDKLSLAQQQDLQIDFMELKYIVLLSTFLLVLFIMGLYKFFVKHIINSVRLLSEEKDQQSQYITSILENTDDLIWAIDNKYRLMGYNSAFLQRRLSQVGLAPKSGEDVLREYYFFEKPTKAKELYDRALNGESFFTETENFENGKPIYYELSFNPTFNEKKSVVGCSVYQRDVTLRIEALKELQQSESNLKQAQEISKLGYWNWDIVENRISWSDQLFKIFGKEPNMFKVDFEKLMAIIHPEDRSIFEENVRQCIAQNKHQDLVSRIVLDNGDIRYVRHRGIVHYDKNNVAIRMAGTTLDITSMEEAKQQISRQNQELQNFVYIISHNVRGPISTLQSLTHLYEMDKGESIPMIMGNINNIVDTLDKTIIDLNHSLNLKNVNENNFKEVDLAEILNNIQVLLGFELEKSKAKIESDFTDVSKIFGIKSYLNNILFNLISNSLKYRSMDRSPLIRISAGTTSENDISLIVEDNGKGMDLNEERRKRIFDMYGRLDGKYDGRGLGLYLVKTQVEAMNGSIEVHSELDRGSIFTITFFNNLHKISSN